MFNNNATDIEPKTKNYYNNCEATHISYIHNEH